MVKSHGKIIGEGMIQDLYLRKNTMLSEQRAGRLRTEAGGHYK